MQVEDHAGYKDTDIWTRWLPVYDDCSYAGKISICKKAITYWNREKWHASLALARVKTDVARKRWNDRIDWSSANERRWQNSLRDCMIAEGVLKHDTVPF